jgi:hypothetical protein
MARAIDNIYVLTCKICKICTHCKRKHDRAYRRIKRMETTTANKTVFRRSTFSGMGMGIILIAVIFGFAAFAIPPASAATATIPVDGSILQSISLTASGSISGWQMNVGQNVRSDITLRRIANTPIKLVYTDPMEANKATTPGTRGHMAAWETANNRYGNPATPIMIAPLMVAYDTGAYFDAVAVDGSTIANNLNPGDVTAPLHIRQDVSFQDIIIPLPNLYRATMQIDTVPA